MRFRDMFARQKKQEGVQEETLVTVSEVSGDGEVSKKVRAVNPTYAQLLEMIYDPIVSFAYRMLTLPVKQSKISVTGETQAQVEFVKQYLINSGVLGDTVSKLLWGVGFGFAGLELRWLKKELGKEQAILPRDPVLLSWSDTIILEQSTKGKDYGSFAGFKVTNPNGGEVFLDVNKHKAALLTWGGEISDRYGTAQLAVAYEAWRRRQLMLYGDFAVWMSRRANPSLIVEYPPGDSQTSSGSKINNVELAKRMAKNTRNGAPAVIPSLKDDKGASLWKIGELSTSDRAPLFEKGNNMLKAEIVMALLVPQRTILEGEHGTKSEAETHGELLGLVQNAILEQVVEVINNYIVKPMLDFNFLKVDGTVRLAYKEISRHMQAAQLSVLNAVIDKWKSDKPLSSEEQDWIHNITGARLYKSSQEPVATVLSSKKPTKKGSPDQLALFKEDR